MPKLERIESEFDINPENVNQLKKLSDKYSQTMKTLNIVIEDLTAEELKKCIEYIARFENLKELKLLFSVIQTRGPIDDCLSLIGQKCTKLLKLELVFHYNVIVYEKFYDIFCEFKAIKKLKLRFPLSTVLSGSVECFKHCKQLNDIDIHYNGLTKDFFANIASFVPKLQSLLIVSINNDLHLQQSLIDSFCSMKGLQTVKVVKDLCGGSIHRTWYFGKCLSEVMLSPNGMNVKHINDNCGYIRH